MFNVMLSANFTEFKMFVFRVFPVFVHIQFMCGKNGPKEH